MITKQVLCRTCVSIFMKSRKLQRGRKESKYMLTTNKLNKYIQGGATKPTISREIETALNFKAFNIKFY